jgi:Ni,Fe-hydrogenase III large subunit
MSYLLPVGPWHPALDEPVVYKLEIAGTKIQQVEIELGFNHRGVEAYIPTLLPHQMIAPLAQVCGKCSYANALVACLALEKLCGLVPPPRAQYLRVATAELERAASHLGNIARTLRLLGINLPAARLEEEREGIHQLLAVTGNRVYDTFNLLGGAMRAPQISADFLLAVEKLRKNVYESANQLLDNRQLERRAIGVGIIDLEMAANYGLVGPVARACEITDDVRRLQPYAAYDELESRVITQRGRDLFSRLAVRALEALESLNIVNQALRRLPEGGLHDEMLPTLFPAESEASAMVESPRGELFCYVAADEKGQLARLKLRTPTTRNLPALPLALTSQEVDDAAAIIASLDYCFACGER